MSYTILVGTAGTGLFRSNDGGDSFDWVYQGISCNEVSVRGFAPDPEDPRHILMATAIHDSGQSSLGTAHGLHESFDGGANWQPVEAFKNVECWRIVFDPNRPGQCYVGTRPAGLYRLDVRSKAATRLDTPFPQICRGIGLPRITSIVLDPDDPDFIFVSVEIGGFFRSRDAGRTWQEVLSTLSDMPVPNGNVYGAGSRFDGHHSALSKGNPDLLIASTPDGSYVSKDYGDNWAHLPVLQIFERQYHHDINLKVNDPDTLYYGIGEDAAGQYGGVLRSRDRGETWDAAKLPMPCNSPVWCFGQHKSNPQRVIACTHYGQVYRSEDGGDSWAKISREFPEIRSVCWVPN